VYFLVSSGSASASELVIIGLEPYMDVVIIGERTFGKYTGAWVIPDTEEPARHNYAMVPIVMKYSNATGFTDFKNGLEPDYPAEDDFLHLKDFGDLDDPFLSMAVELISRIPGKKSTISHPKVEVLKSKKELLKMNLIFPHGEIPIELIEKSDIIR
jgi:C-terminal processing protease CtpA/Prc